METTESESLVEPQTLSNDDPLEFDKLKPVPKEVTLDLEHWKGHKLLTEDGYYCVMGKILLDLGVPEGFLRGCGDIRLTGRGLTLPEEIANTVGGRVELTDFSSVAIGINDSTSSRSTRIARLREHLNNHGIALHFKDGENLDHDPFAERLNDVYGEGC